MMIGAAMKWQPWREQRWENAGSLLWDVVIPEEGMLGSDGMQCQH